MSVLWVIFKEVTRSKDTSITYTVSPLAPPPRAGPSRQPSPQLCPGSFPTPCPPPCAGHHPPWPPRPLRPLSIYPFPPSQHPGPLRPQSCQALVCLLPTSGPMQLQMPALGPASQSPCPKPQQWANSTHQHTAFPTKVGYSGISAFSAAPSQQMFCLWPDGSLSDVSLQRQAGLLLRFRAKVQKFTPNLPWAICRSIWEAGQESGPNFPRHQNTEGEHGAGLCGTSSHTHTILGLGNEWQVIANSHETIPSPSSHRITKLRGRGSLTHCCLSLPSSIGSDLGCFSPWRRWIDGWICG